MIDAVRYDHHNKGQSPPDNCQHYLHPAIACRDGDEPVDKLPEPHQKPDVKQAHNTDDVPVGSFNRSFRAVVHASHAAFTAVGPERAVVYSQNSLYRAVVDAEVAFIAGIGRIKRFSQDEPPDEKIADAHRRNKQILNNIAERRVNFFPAEDFTCKSNGDAFTMTVN